MSDSKLPLQARSEEQRLEYYERVFREHKNAGWDQAPGKEVILNVLGRTRLLLPDVGAICDIGCGTGLMLERIRREVFPDWKYYGLDFSQTAIAAAKIDFPHIDFRAEDGSRTSFGAASMDAVISYGSYEHFPDPSLGIRELARILKPGAHFFLMIPTNDGYWEEPGAEIGWYPDKGGQPQWNYPRAHWDGIFRDNGLTLWPDSKVECYGARNACVFFFGSAATG
jgi:SAM-dependent methyltransferase